VTWYQSWRCRSALAGSEPVPVLELPSRRSGEKEVLRPLDRKGEGGGAGSGGLEQRRKGLGGVVSWSLGGGGAVLRSMRREVVVLEMAGQEDAPVVTVKELAAVLQAMDEKYYLGSHLIDAKLQVSIAICSHNCASIIYDRREYKVMFDAIRKQGESSKSENEMEEEVHPLQTPSVKLKGAESYANWSEHAETILVSRKLEGYILKTIEKPADENSREGRRRKMTNALVRAGIATNC
jgi:hypothetical protein